jgi:hypothetical protein
VPLVPYVLAIVLGIAAGMPWAVVFPSFLGFALLLGPRILSLFERGSIELTIEPGRIGIGRVRTLRARDVGGASTARTDHGVAITIRTKWGEPTSLVVRGENVANEILTALGIGHSGSGNLQWLLVSRAYSVGVFVADAALCIAFALALAILPDDHAALGFFLLGFFPMLAAFAVRSQWKSSAFTFVFDPWGLWVRGALVPWSDIDEAHLQPEGIVLVRRNGTELVAVIPPGSMKAEEKSVILDQIRGAVARARGLGRPKAEPHTRIDILARNGDDARKWLARIDAIATDLGNATYRGRGIDPNDLWLTLEDPDAPADLRAAAARVLVRVAPDKKVRIDSLIAATRTNDDEQQLRIAMEPDVEEAVTKLERLEAHGST